MAERWMTLDQLFAEREAAVKAEIATPEYAAMMERQSARFAADEASRLAWEAENPWKVSYELGATAAQDEAERDPPVDVPDAAGWFEGYDANLPDEVTP